ncbi:hypothetical protein B0J12DRAFT_744362 [Macrophomina phaseolina]|uniref:HAUS augmin-like complex subunit 1 n=1 Tax=Macrophomina phaseolina TaxID=35725 RepID=A0ABQ8FYR9_9PEZI|nr:hypothetical protein B0J12DRAFT_744362 [Macrophomina phaseolina]
MDDSALGDALFSPSKAAQQRAQAHDWQHVEAWLSSLYPNRPLPTFERNDETLKVLLALAAANERADEEAALMQALEEEVRHELDEADVETADEQADCQLLCTIKEHLTSDGKQSLDALAQLSTTLNAPSTDPETLAHALLTQTTQSQTLTIHTATLHHLRTLLTTSLAHLRATLQEITAAPAFASPPASLPRQTADYLRQTKQLLPKLQEYSDRLAALPISASLVDADDAPPSPTKPRSPKHTRTRSANANARHPLANNNPLAAPGAAAAYLASPAAGPLSSGALTALLAAEEEVSQLRALVVRLEAQVRAYRDLPADREEARRLVRERETVLADMKERRDGRFEALVE